MNTGELKAIVNDFVQMTEAVKSKLYDSDMASLTMLSRQAEQIAGRIVAAKITNGDYKGKNFYHDEEMNLLMKGQDNANIRL